MSKISELAAAAALTGDEQVPVVQTGATVRTTIGDLLASGAYAPAGDYVESTDVTSIVKLTQAQYEGLDPADPDTLYIVVPA